MLTLSSPGGVTLTYSYDGLLPTGVSWSGPITGSVGYSYNNDFAPAAVRVNDSALASFGYDNDGLLLTAGQMGIARSNQTGLITGTAVGGVSTTLTHNGFGELTGQTATFAGDTLYQAAYTRDNGGRITGLTETARGVPTTWDYDYSASGRLFRVVRDSADTTVYSYDANGNRLQVVSPLGTVTGTYDGEARLQTYGGADYTYNNAGQLTRKDAGGQVTSYTYDVLGNLTGVTLPDSTRITYLVDGQGRRIGKQVNGVLVQGWLWQGQLAPVAELDGSGQVVSRFVYGTRVNVPDYMERGGATYRLVTNHLGSVELVVNATSGQVVSWRDYDAWGRVVADSNPDFQPFGFAGGLTDAATGLVRFGARDYDADTGAWTAKDPLGFDGQDTNLYAYVMSDPVNVTDPNGQCPWCIAVALGGLAGGASDLLAQLALNGGRIECVDWSDVLMGAGIGGLGSGLGGATMLKRVGTDFSHWIPERFISPTSKYYKPWLDNALGKWFINSKLNGNYVDVTTHALTDPWRNLAGQSRADKLPAMIRQMIGLPAWLVGGAGGSQAGAIVGAGSGCNCQ